VDAALHIQEERHPEVSSILQIITNPYPQ
jgi:hypothetical protein